MTDHKKRNVPVTATAAILVLGGFFLDRLVPRSMFVTGGTNAGPYIVLAVVVVVQAAVVLSGIYVFLKKPALKQMFFSILMAVIVFGGVEAGARLWLQCFATHGQYLKYALYPDIDPKDRKWARHPYLNYFPRPGYQNEGASHNSLGYRGEEISHKKPEGVFRIVFLGGSTTYSVSVGKNEQVFTEILQRLLRENYGYPQVEVINAGVPAYTSWESLVNLEFRVLDLEPDLIVVYHGLNDVHSRLVNPAAYRGDNTGRWIPWTEPEIDWWEHIAFLRIFMRATGASTQVDLEHFIRAPTSQPLLKSALFNTILGGTPMETLQKNPPVYFERNLRCMAAIAKAFKIKMVLSSWAHSSNFDDYSSTPHYEQGFAEHNQIIEKVAEEENVLFYDFANEMPKDKQYWREGRHVNLFGSPVKAELFAKYIDGLGIIPKK